MKIAYIFMTFPMQAQAFAISDVAALRDLGHQVKAFALRRPPVGADDIARDNGIRDIPVSQPGKFASIDGLWPSRWRYLWRGMMTLLKTSLSRPKDIAKCVALLPRMAAVAKELEEFKPDAVHVFWGHYPALVLDMATLAVPQAHRSIFLGAYDMLRAFPATSYVANRADSIWTHAQENVSILAEHGCDTRKLHVSVRGVPLDLVDGVRTERVPYHIVSAANFQKEKNLDRLIDAFDEIYQVFPQARLTLAGDGEQRQALEAQVRNLGLTDVVRFTGLLDRPGLFSLMASGDLFVFLSTKASERLPNVVKEALLAQCYCIVSDTIGIRQLIPDERHGVVLPQASVEAAVDAIRTAFENRDALADARMRGAEHIKAHFSSRVIMERHIKVWQGGSAAPITEVQEQVTTMAGAGGHE